MASSSALGEFGSEALTWEPGSFSQGHRTLAEAGASLLVPLRVPAMSTRSFLAEGDVEFIPV